MNYLGKIEETWDVEEFGHLDLTFGQRRIGHLTSDI
jgi:hypothetical protein